MRMLFQIRDRLLSLLSAVGMLAVLSAWQPVQAAETTTITDLAGREITLELPVKSMVIPGWSVRAIHFSHVCADGRRRYGYDRWDWRQSSQISSLDLGEICRALPGIGEHPNVGRPPEPNVEKIISLKPDVVVVPTSAYVSAQDAMEPWKGGDSRGAD